MRLIDADALKKYAIPCEIHNGALTDLCVPLYHIDNAPTVYPDMAQVLAYESGKASAESPATCGNCQFKDSDKCEKENQQSFGFCGNWCADMRKGGAE